MEREMKSALVVPELFTCGWLVLATEARTCNKMTLMRGAPPCSWPYCATPELEWGHYQASSGKLWGFPLLQCHSACLPASPSE